MQLYERWSFSFVAGASSVVVVSGDQIQLRFMVVFGYRVTEPTASKMA